MFKLFVSLLGCPVVGAIIALGFNKPLAGGMVAVLGVAVAALGAKKWLAEGSS